MKKHFKSEPKLYRKLSESLSETEIEFRRASHEFLADELRLKCAIREKVPPSKGNFVKVSKPLKIKEEVKIDLRKSDSSSESSGRSPPKIFTIPEDSEGVSHASSKMVLKEKKRTQEVKKIMEANRNKQRPKSRSRNIEMFKPLHIPSDVEILKPFCALEESSMESEFAKEFDLGREKNGSMSSSYQERLDEINSSYGSLGPFKREQMRRLASDVADFQNQKKQSRSFCSDSQHELLSVRTYSTTSSERGSCFGCFFKPLARMCGRKSKKN